MYSEENSSEEVAYNPPTVIEEIPITVSQRAPDKKAWSNPPTDQMCFVNFNMARNNQMQDHVLLNIQIVRCKPDEICDPTSPDSSESQYYGNDLGYVFFKALKSSYLVRPFWDSKFKRFSLLKIKLYIVTNLNFAPS